MHELTYTLARGDQTVILDVVYDVADRIPASGPSWNDPGSPEEGGEITELKIQFEGVDFTMTQSELDALEQHIYETHDYSDDGYDPDMDGRTWSSD